MKHQIVLYKLPKYSMSWHYFGGNGIIGQIVSFQVLSIDCSENVGSVLPLDSSAKLLQNYNM